MSRENGVKLVPTTTASGPLFDVIIPMRNEAKKLPAFVEMLREQTLQPQRILIADGRSTDDSRALVALLTKGLPGVIVLDNPKRIVPAGLNVCLKHAQSPVVARMDTHAEYDPRYLESVVAALASDDRLSGVGGAMRTAGKGPWGRAIASTLSRSFGLGGARHRVGGAAGPINHVFSGCYRTEALRSIGGWDERLRANEDFEADTRITNTGGRLWLEPTAKSTWFVRESPRSLAVQMWRYGYYKGLTLNLHPSSIKARQLVPPLALVLAGVGLVKAPRSTLLGTVGYLGVSAGMGAAAAARDGADGWRGAFVPPIVHLSWGAGLLVGITRFSRTKRPKGLGALNG